jgi:hypothetical protein
MKQSYRVQYAKADCTDKPQTLIKTLFLFLRTCIRTTCKCLQFSHKPKVTAKRNIKTGLSLKVQNYAMKWAREKANIMSMSGISIPPYRHPNQKHDCSYYDHSNRYTKHALHMTNQPRMVSFKSKKDWYWTIWIFQNLFSKSIQKPKLNQQQKILDVLLRMETTSFG